MKLEFSELAQTELEDARVLDNRIVIVSVAHQHRKPFFEC